MTYPLPHQSVGFHFESDLPLVTMKGMGLQTIHSHSYDWDNRNRPDSHCVLQLCLEGEGALEYEGLSYRILPMQAFVADIPGKSRYYLPKDSGHWEVLFLEFSKESLPMLRKILGCCGPVLDFSSRPELIKTIVQAYEQVLQGKYQNLFENARFAVNLWLDLTEFAIESAGSTQSKAHQAKQYIDQNYQNDGLNLDEIVDNIGVSKYHLCRSFSKAFGITPGSYLKEVRIAQACRLLAMNRDYTLEQIAGKVGYANSSYFGKVFKSAKGMTPDQYRRSNTQYDVVHIVYEESDWVNKTRNSDSSEKSGED